MTDLRLPLEDTMFALRAGILCVEGGRLLVIRGEGFSFKYLPGGAVHLGEDTAGAAAREWFEETGLTAGPLRLLGVVENFFPLGGRRWLEVGFSGRLEWNAAWPPLTALADQAGQQFEWVALDDLAKERVFPRAAEQLLQVLPGEVLHLTERAE